MADKRNQGNIQKIWSDLQNCPPSVEYRCELCGHTYISEAVPTMDTANGGAMVVCKKCQKRVHLWEKANGRESDDGRA